MKDSVRHRLALSTFKRTTLIIALLLTTIFSGLLQNSDASANSYSASKEQDCSWLNTAPGNIYGEDGYVTHVILEPMNRSNQFDVQPGQQSIQVRVKGSISLCAEHANRQGQGYISRTSQALRQIRERDSGRLSSPDIGFGWYNKARGDRVKLYSETVGWLNVNNLRQGNNFLCFTHASESTVNPVWTSPTDPNCYNININFVQSWSVSQEQAYIQRVAPGDTTSNIGGKLGPMINAAPGQHYKFVYQWINNGPDATSRTVNIGRTYAYPGAATIDQQSFASAGAGVPRNGNVYFGMSGHTGVIQQTDVGSSFCMQTYVAPRAWNNNGRNSGTPLCVNVPYNYTLIPSIDVPSDVVEAGAKIPNITPRVSNTGATKTRPNIDWVVTRIIVPAGGSISQSQVETGAEPCVHFRSGSGNNNDCTSVKNGQREFPSGGPTTITEGILSGETVDDLEAGQRVCYATSLRPYSTDPGGSRWRHSAAQCMTVGKKPKLQIHGGDLSVGKYFDGQTAPTTASIVDTGISEKQTGTYGSWIEYGILASGAITGSASASGLSGSGRPNAQNSWSDLTFANTNTSACPFGCYNQANTMGMMPNIIAEFPVSATTPVAPSSSSIDALNGVYRGSGTIRLLAGELPAGRTVVINAPSARVIIESNGGDNSLRYANGPYTSINDLPQLIIIADRIDIRDSVERVDGWLIAKSNGTQGSSGIVDTCAFNDNYNAALTSETCGTQLTINGPVMAEKLWLRRTAGSGTGPQDSGNPAEIINLRADTYLWATARSEADGRARTVKQTDVAPRF